MTRGRLSLTVFSLGMALAAPSLAQRLPTYEPSQRARTAMDVCLKDEVMNGAYCVKKCQSGFRLDLSRRPPVCIGLTESAKYVPPKPGYVPPPKGPPVKPPPGA